jgi:DNA polymerase-1
LRTLLIDGDIDAYKIAARNERKIDWGDGNVSTTTDADEAKAQIDAFYRKLKKMLGADRIIVGLSDSANFRKLIYPPYKANRANVIKPALLYELKQHLRDNYEVFQRPQLEADDVLGILATVGDVPGLITGTRIVVSEDKDLRCIPGLLFNPRHPDKGTVEISVEGADLAHLRQTLTGDPTDNYPGCPGIGAVKAEKVLFKKNPEDRLWDLVVAAFKKKGMTEQDAIVQAQVARICRAEDYDFTNKRPIPWMPPTPNSKAVA